MVTAVTIIPAINMPAAIAGNEFLNFIPNTKAAAHPVHAPVTGRGMATKSVRASSPTKNSDVRLLKRHERNQIVARSNSNGQGEKGDYREDSRPKRNSLRVPCGRYP